MIKEPIVFNVQCSEYLCYSERDIAHGYRHLDELYFSDGCALGFAEVFDHVVPEGECEVEDVAGDGLNEELHHQGRLSVDVLEYIIL